MIRLPKFLQRSNAPVEAPPVLEGPVQDEGVHGTLIEHLVELRTRIIRAALAVLIVFLVLFPWSRDWYALLAEPMIAALPQGGRGLPQVAQSLHISSHLSTLRSPE